MRLPIRPHRLAILLFAAALPGAAGAQPTLTAVRVQQPPTIDGEVAGDPAWSAAAPASGFAQEQPDEGRPSTERTDVRIVYTASTIYVGVICYDREPGGIIVSDARRDAALDQTDSFQIIFDTYRDRLNGFVFGTNPAGIEYDGQVTNEGQGGAGLAGGQRQQGGAGSGFNVNWDGAWEVRSRISEIGWSAEFAIPFRTLRFPSGAPQTWGVNFQRNIRRRNERSYWAPVPRQYNLYRLSLAGVLTGLEAPALRNLKLTPFVLGQALASGVRPVDATFDPDAGMDLKYSVTPSLVLDLTVNTDFAQVEIDDQQVNLDRFDLFFPEKRPFFLENAGFFTVGNPGEIDLFFSRRIGIGPSGEQIAINGGGRLSGKAGKYNVGLLTMQTDDVALLNVPPGAPHDRLSGSNFTVARVSRDLPNRSSIGALVTSRVGVGRFARDHDYNRTYAVDGKAGLRQHTVVSSFVAKSSTYGVDAGDTAFNVRSRTSVPRFDLELGYQEIGARFNPEVGFYTRRGYRKPDARILTRWRPRIWKLQELRPHSSYRAFYGIDDGLLESMQIHIDNHWQFRNSYEVHTGMNVVEEGLRRPFEIYPGIFVPAGSYKSKEAQLVFMTNQGAPVSLHAESRIGGFFGGDRVTFVPTLRVRAGEALTAEVAYQRNDVNLPWGSFDTNLLRTRISYSFTTHTFLQGLVQYNDRADQWSMNLRFGWLQAANTGLFVVYTDTRGLYDLFDRPQRTDRSLVVKFSRLFDLLR
ncbi:MAG TPA: DUF5916 domain-containing protein [Vicinamibacterales bacterium]|nr:DUF5916 domain-containing protein [Vicinamibacterales bacterium]